MSTVERTDAKLHRGYLQYFPKGPISPKRVVAILPSLNEQGNILRVVKAVDRGLSRIAQPKECLILNVDGGSHDQTRAVFLSAHTRCPKLSLGNRAGPKGKGSGLLAGLKLCVDIDAQYAITVDTDVKSIGEEWPRLLLQHIINGGYDYVTPLYARNRFEGSTTNHFAFPLVYSVFGKLVRQPIGGEFGLRNIVMRYLLEQPARGPVCGYGIDIFMTCHALGGRFRVAQVILGKKIHKPSFYHIVKTFEETAASAIIATTPYFENQPRASTVGGDHAEDLVGNRVSLRVNRVDSGRLLKHCRVEFQRRIDQYRPILGNLTVVFEKEMHKQEPTLSEELWTEALSIFLREEFRERSRLVSILRTTRLIVPLFIARTLTFWNEIESLDPRDVEEAITHQAYLMRQKFRK